MATERSPWLTGQASCFAASALLGCGTDIVIPGPFSTEYAAIVEAQGGQVIKGAWLSKDRTSATRVEVDAISDVGLFEISLASIEELGISEDQIPDAGAVEPLAGCASPLPNPINIQTILGEAEVLRALKPTTTWLRESCPERQLDAEVGGYCGYECSVSIRIADHDRCAFALTARGCSLNSNGHLLPDGSACFDSAPHGCMHQGTRGRAVSHQSCVEESSSALCRVGIVARPPEPTQTILPLLPPGAQPLIGFSEVLCPQRGWLLDVATSSDGHVFVSRNTTPPSECVAPAESSLLVVDPDTLEVVSTATIAGGALALMPVRGDGSRMLAIIQTAEGFAAATLDRRGRSSPPLALAPPEARIIGAGHAEGVDRYVIVMREAARQIRIHLLALDDSSSPPRSVWSGAAGPNIPVPSSAIVTHEERILSETSGNNLWRAFVRSSTLDELGLFVSVGDGPASPSLVAAASTGEIVFVWRGQEDHIATSLRGRYDLDDFDVTGRVQVLAPWSQGLLFYGIHSTAGELHTGLFDARSGFVLSALQRRQPELGTLTDFTTDHQGRLWLMDPGTASLLILAPSS